MTAGVSTEGFELKTLEQILEDINAEMLESISPTLDLSPDQPLGQINAIFAKQLAEVWEVAQTAYNAFNRGAAEGTLLDNIGLLTGTLRLPATRSTVQLRVNLTAGTTLVGGVATANVVDDPTNRWIVRETFTAPVDGYYLMMADAEFPGPVTANDITITKITTAVAGWNYVSNNGDAVPGREAETDTEYRIRQQLEFAAVGSSTAEAIRADVLQVTGVRQAFVFENNTSVINTQGIPPHSFQVVIWDGASPAADDDEVAAAIFKSKPAGIGTFGSVHVVVVDSSGSDRDIYFDRASQKPIFLEYTITTDDTFPVDGVQQIEDLIVAKGLTMNMGDDVIALVWQIVPLSVQGVIDVPNLNLDFTGPPAPSANLAIGPRQIATFSASNVVINVT